MPKIGKTTWLTLLCVIVACVAYVAFLVVSNHTAKATKPQLVPVATVGAPSASRYQTSCQFQGRGCRVYLLGLVNAARTALAVPKVGLDLNLSRGIGCVGAAGHALAMAKDGQAQPIWHIAPDVAYAYASWPDDVRGCILGYGAQNIGYDPPPTTEVDSIAAIHALMLSEPHDALTCATQINHACSLLSPLYHRVGLALYDGPQGWLVVEDFES